MQSLTIDFSNLLKNFENTLLKSQDTLFSLLLEGDLHSFEELVYRLFLEMYDNFCEHFLSLFAQSKVFKNCLQHYGASLGLGAFKLRSTKLQLRTGTYIEFRSYDATKAPKSYQKTRHLCHRYWSCFVKASPCYASQMSMLSVICPSYELASQVAESQGIKANYNRVLKVSKAFAKSCFDKRVGISLEASESLASKRVIIAMDGGRSRCRENTNQYKEGSQYSKYETPWREPKLFVIQVIGEDGEILRKELPIYDCTLQDCEASFDLLKDYLKHLQIQEAKEIQFIADGAPWLWNRCKDALLSVGVQAEKMTETLDYYHAVEHLSELIKQIPKKKKKQKKDLFKKLKETLWQGNIGDMIAQIRKCGKKMSKKMKTELTYFIKHRHRMKYAQFRSKKLLCGSGIVESAIRRIINLRFKSPSTFWKEDNLEKMIFLRANLLAKRWNIIIKNLTRKMGTI